MGNTISSYIPTSIKVLSLEDAYEQMAINESEDQYLRSCTESPPNMDAIHKIYLKPCHPPVQTETMTNTAIMKISLMPSSTIKIGVFEEGLPHTRPPATIWFPESLLNGSAAKFQETFLHECIHLHQREHEDLWDDFYRKYWNCIRYKGTIPREIEERRRINPDTIRAPFYGWLGPDGKQGPYIPVVIYKKPEDAELTQVRLVFLKPDGSWTAVIPPGWMEFFGTQNPSLCEHPHEMAAYILSDNTNPFDSVAARHLKNMYSTFNRTRK